MSWEHDRVEELLAGHALGGLDPEDASLAGRALEEHVPDCERCRKAWDGFREVAADLALASPAIQPPDTLDARVRRVTRRPERVRPFTAAATAAAAVIVAFSGFSMIRAGQLGDQLDAATATQNSLFDVVSTVANPEHETIPLTGAGNTKAALYYQPGEPRGYLMATNLPRPDFQYHVWFMKDERVWHAGVLRVDEGGRAVFPCKTDPTQWDAVMLVDEPRQPEPSSSPLVSATFPTEAAA